MHKWIRTLSLEDLPPGATRSVTVEGRAIALYNVAGEIYATADACKDQGYSLGTHGALEGYVVTCGLHYWEYDVRTGSSVDGMDEQLERYEAEVRDGEIYVQAPSPLPCGQERCTSS